jgi:threonine/homoserine/homoserine lactone efflux protein
MHGAEVKAAIALWFAGGLFVLVAARPLLQSTPRMIAVPTIVVGAVMLARGVWLLLRFRRGG